MFKTLIAITASTKKTEWNPQNMADLGQIPYRHKFLKGSFWLDETIEVL